MPITGGNKQQSPRKGDIDKLHKNELFHEDFQSLGPYMQNAFAKESLDFLIQQVASQSVTTKLFHIRYEERGSHFLLKYIHF